MNSNHLSTMPSIQRLSAAYAAFHLDHNPSVATQPPVGLSTRSVPSEAYAFVGTLPRSWLSAIFRAFRGNRSVPKLALLHFEALRRGLIDPQDYTMRDLFCARDALGIKLTDDTLRASMKMTEGLFWRSNPNPTNSRPPNDMSPRGGRPRHHFRALPLEEVEQNLLHRAEKRIEEAQHRDWETTPPLTEAMISVLDGDARRAAQVVAEQAPPPDQETAKSAYFARQEIGALSRSLKDHDSVDIPLDSDNLRVALFAAENDPDVARSYREIKRAYGVSLGGVATLATRAGLQAEKQYVEYPITSAAALEGEVRKACKESHGFPCALVVTTASGEKAEHYFSPSSVESAQPMVAAALTSGSTVQVRIQTASKYRPLDPDQQTTRQTSVHRRAASHGSRRATIAPYYGDGYNRSLVLEWLKTTCASRGGQNVPMEYGLMETAKSMI